MSSNETSLLFRLRGENTQLRSTIADSRSAIASLRGSVGAEFGQIQKASTQSLGAVTQSLSQVTSQIPIVGTAVNGLSSHLGTMTTASQGAAAGMAGMAGPLSIAVVGITATATAVATLGTQLFGLAKSSAEFQGKLFDLGQQTGVNIETLSALEIVAATTGGSIDSIAQSLVVFQGKLDDAQDSTSKAGKQFKELGISTASTEEALRSALTVLSQMPEGFNQTNAAAELFGRRGGKQLLAILKETNGDLDGAIEKFRAMGILVSGESARAADEFNDQLALLNFQLRAVGATIGKEIVPVALEAIKDLSQALKDNKDAINDVATAAGLLSNLFTGPLKGAIIVIEDQWEKIRPVLEATAELYERIARAVNAIRGKTDFTTAGAGATGAGLGDSVDFGLEAGFNLPGPKTTDVQAGLKRSEDQAAKELELHRKRTEALRAEHDRRALDVSTFYNKQAALADERFNVLSSQITRERQLNEEAFNRGIIDLETFEDRKRDLDLRSIKAENERDEAKRRLRLERDREGIRQELKLREGLIAIDQARRDGEIQRFEDGLERQAILESSVITKRLEFLTAAHKERLGLIAFELQAEGTSAERKEELNNQKTILEQRYTDEFKRLTRERINVLGEEAAASGPSKVAEPNLSGLGIAIEGQVGPPPWMADTTDAFGSLGQAISTTLGLGQEFGQFFGDTLTNTFQQLALAVGESVHAFVLFGNAGGGVRKFTATLIAEIARMAAVQAIWELAQGFAMLALNFFWPDPKLAASATAHFHAAAIYGGMAAVAAGAGRLVAGGAFQQAGGGTGGSGGGNPGRNPSDRSLATGTPSAIDADRRRFGESVVVQPQVYVTVTGQATEGFKYMVEDVAVESVRLNGPFRKIQKGEDV